MKKRCSKCLKRKSASGFHVRRESKDGLNAACKDCVRGAWQERYDDPGIRKSIRAAIHKRRAQHPHKDRQYNLKAKFGITLLAYEVMLAGQGGCCAICKRPPASDTKLAVDHCHKTGKVRGLLCRACNHGIGNFGDEPEQLKAAIAYLERTQVVEIHQ